MLGSGYFGEGNNYVRGQVKPRNDNVLVRLLPPPKESTSLIVEPDRDYKQTEGAWADVVAVGGGPSYRKHCRHCNRGHDAWADDLRPGDRVLLNSAQSGDVVVIDGAEHRIVRKAEIELVVDP